MTTLRAVLAAIALSILPVHPATSIQPAPSDPIFESLATLVTAKMQEYRIPGVAMGVLRNGQTTIRGFGIRNVNDPQPVTGSTVFPLASISKTVTTTAVMRLVEQGKIDLHAPVRKYLPDFRVADEAVSR
ncbi:MAG TPA: serine hydrolase domain-containing protein, partial [Vicinamibacterales bacterium]|nr:serine hydrolase domain-containing protein [Vicinamibacterales bacterium]